MPKTVAKILDILSARIVEKYKPVVIGVFDDYDGKVSAMIKEILEKRYAVHLGDPIREPETEIPYALIGTGKTGHEEAEAVMRGMGLALRKDNAYPHVVILRMEACKTGSMKKFLEKVRPAMAVFAGGETCCAGDAAGKKKIRHALGEKSLLLRSLRKNDLAIFCADDETVKALAQKSRCAKMAYGFGEEAKVRGRIFHGEEGSDEGTSFKISYRGTIVPFRFPMATGKMEVCAALAAAAVGLHMGFNLVEISEVLRR